MRAREEFSGVGVDDADVEVVDEQDDGGSCVCSADGDVVHPAGTSERHGPGFVDSVVSDSVVGSGV